MAFTDLDKQLQALQAGIVQRSNDGLLFGGTTKSEYDFLTKAAQDNSGLNFYSFMAGLQGGNLAEQERRATQFDQAQALRTQNSNIALQQSQIGRTDIQTELDQATLPYAASTAYADYQGRQALADQRALENSWIPAKAQSDIARNNALNDQYALENSWIPAKAQTEIARNNALAGYNDARAGVAEAKAAGSTQYAVPPAFAGATQPRAAEPPPTATSPSTAVNTTPAFPSSAVALLQQVYAKKTSAPSYQLTPQELQVYQAYQKYIQAGGQQIAFGAAP